ncbi:uncharacterized protein LOC120276178 [Dioscorea cayenensis subsp. rotundata]|uniref:Uncharacterized protein LOC120276178 n=1 Tax=Dioscorea cayennensis subsp. rotundata TaxID=55577 RepID=A0AB40CJN8_DIOCR|nr:uncharacterized protein LOC120276178 [Dioscorea cayenensis subsp. rotundata]
MTYGHKSSCKAHNYLFQLLCGQVLMPCITPKPKATRLAEGESSIKRVIGTRLTTDLLNEIGSLTSSIVRPPVTANNFELKSTFVQIVQNSIEFHGLPNDYPNSHIGGFFEKFEAELESVEGELMLMKEREIETETLVASLNEELKKSMSKLSEIEEKGCVKSERLREKKDIGREMSSEYKPALSQALSLGVVEGG